MYEAYCRIFDRCGLDYLAGRSRERPDRRRRQPRVHGPGRQRRRPVVHCAACGYAANLERAETGRDAAAPTAASRAKPLTKVDTPQRRQHRAGQQAAQVQAAADDQDADLRGRRASRWPCWSAATTKPTKAKSAARSGRAKLELADAGSRSQQVTGAPVGFAGPVGLSSAPIWADHDVAGDAPMPSPAPTKPTSTTPA